MQGVFDGIHQENGVPFVRVRVQRDFAHRTSGTTYVVGRNQAANLYIDPDGDGELRKHIYSRSTVKNAAFLGALYTPNEAKLIHISSVPLVTIIGRISVIHSEVCEERFGDNTKLGRYSEGF